MSAANFGALLRIMFSLAWLLSSPAGAASWTASIDQRNGLPSILKGGGAAVSSDFVFWGKDSAWANLAKVFKVVAPYNYSIAGQDQMLNFALNGRVTRASSQQLRWEFDLNASNTTSDVIGGGIAFRFDLANFSSEVGEPELLPDNRGWSWGRRGSTRMEMRFDPPLPYIAFERVGNKSEVRAFFYKGTVPAGHQYYVATLNIYGDIEVIPTTVEQFGLDDDSTWPTNILDWRTAPVDLSFLNAPERPAGKHGFLRSNKDKLVFEDGTPVRFWGTNLASYTLFGTTRENVKQQAHRLSELGFNLVRIHQHDAPFTIPNIFGNRTALDTQNLSLGMLTKLDWWIKCFEDEGIYVWLDLQDYRQFKFADRIDGFSEISKGKPTADLQGYNYVNTSIEDAMQRFDEEYMNHRNSFSGLAYKDDPAIVALMLTNENVVTFHFGNRLLPIQKVPLHGALYMLQAEAFATKYGLAKDKTWRSWEQGPSKLFLNDLEHRFDTKMIKQLRELGVKVPIVTTSY